MFPVEAFQATLGKATEIFQRLGIRFHLTGGVTSILYGEPRMTQDIDMVVDNQALADQLETFLRLLDTGDFLFDATSVRRAVERREMFQLLDKVEALKLDVYPRELIAGELDRSCMIEVFAGVRLPVVSRVDSAAAKLVWISKGSHKSRRDLRQIYRTSSESDRQQIRKLASEINLMSLLNEVLGESDELA
ncbi:MAG: nucleotidyl transferase AbiEii/AbiGii toxin family protein [Rubripirellula sp.]